MIALGTASFIAFGVFSLPAGWLADRWSRRNMMALFYFGCGVSLLAAAFSPTLIVLAGALFLLGMFAAIYHPVGMAMLIEASKARGRTLAFNGVCGNLGVALAAGITAFIASYFTWRAAFARSGDRLPCDRLRLSLRSCRTTGIMPRSASPRRRCA